MACCCKSVLPEDDGADPSELGPDRPEGLVPAQLLRQQRAKALELLRQGVHHRAVLERFPALTYAGPKRISACSGMQSPQLGP
ncbi:hypothetical protein D7Y15_23225 [Corallococcus sp. AB030]|uniref:hypothetical protein n=1 Tax=Corallococcus sp. AB030 TaxID=2316716 RepID=UPI000EE4BDE6|nr:hypothetical protein [Corallococcus sp. AB030]RKI09813.1 hypothetical protein D7Y15_23225 [Corallococcus sp. AB030]